MTSTKRAKLEVTDNQKNVLNAQLEQLTTQFKQRLEQYEKQTGTPYPVQLKESSDYDYINPQHYVSDDGRQTWERMVDKWGLQATALWCEMTVFKYTDTRIGKKPNEDTEREQKKIEWYLAKAAELYELAEQETIDGLSGTFQSQEEKPKKGWFD
jgi:hypothetical protein